MGMGHLGCREGIPALCPSMDVMWALGKMTERERAWRMKSANPVYLALSETGSFGGACLTASNRSPTVNALTDGGGRKSSIIISKNPPKPSL